MKKLGTTGIKILKIIHLLFAVMWIGGGISLLLVLFLSSPETGEEFYMRSRALQIIDDWVIIPGAMASFLIGLVYGIWTNWGFFKYKWLTAKWVLTVAQILFGTFILGPWINENVELSRQFGNEIVSNPVFLHNIEMSKIFGTLQVSLLLLFIILSVLKPWKAKRKKV